MARGKRRGGQDVSSSYKRLREEPAHRNKYLKDTINDSYSLQLLIDLNSVVFITLGAVKLSSEKLKKRLSKTGILIFYVRLNGIT